MWLRGEKVGWGDIWRNERSDIADMSWWVIHVEEVKRICSKLDQIWFSSAFLLLLAEREEEKTKKKTTEEAGEEGLKISESMHERARDGKGVSRWQRAEPEGGEMRRQEREESQTDDVCVRC